MDIVIVNADNDIVISPIENEYILEENHNYIVTSKSKSFQRHDFSKIGLYIEPEKGILRSTNKIGVFNLKGTNIRFTSKIGEDFYQLLLEKISNIEKELILSSNSIQEVFGLNYGNFLDEVAVSIFLKSWKKTKLILEYILSTPVFSYKNKLIEKNLLKGDFLEENDFYNLHNNSESIIKYNDKCFPYNFSTNINYETLDTLEMRFFKFFIEFCLNIFRKRHYLLEKLILDKKQKIISINNKNNVQHNFLKKEQTEINNLTELKKENDKIKSTLNGFLHNKKLLGVKKLNNFDFTSIRLHNKFQFKHVLNLYLRMKKSFEVIENKNNVFLNINSIENLYEYYCFIKILIDFNVKREEINRVIIKEKLGRTINTAHPVKLGEWKGLCFLLFFKKSFSENETYSQQYSPDYTIKITNGNNDIFYFHLDAKYKVINFSVSKDDIDKMHTYAHAIKNTIGSYVLYPGRKNTYYTCEKSTIGAIYCTPQFEQNMSDVFLKEILPQLFNFLKN